MTSSRQQSISLETDTLRASFHPATGALTGLFVKVCGWELITRPALGLSWRMLLPTEGRRLNEAWGGEQEAPACEVSSSRVCFSWERVRTRCAGTLPIRVQTVCEIDEGQLVFRMHVENNSELTVENVYYPYLGDLHRPDGCRRLTFSHLDYMDMQTAELYPRFLNFPGTHATKYPTMTTPGNHTTPPLHPYGLIEDERGNGLYIGAAERRIEAAAWHAEAHPAWRDSLDFRLYDGDETGGEPVFTRFAVGHLPYIAPHTSFSLLPFGLAGYTGGWHNGAAHYTRMSRRWNLSPKKYPVPLWAREPHAWLQVQMNTPEDDLRVPYSELPKIGEECRRYGIKALQLVGWNDGGQDRNNPLHDTDPRLGTPEELMAGIRAIQAMGVKVVLFAKLTWADESRPDFHTLYKPMAVKDPYGNYYKFRGYQYYTLSQLADVNPRRLIPMCYASEDYAAVCRREIEKCMALGADGVLIDEIQHHGNTLCCFDESHGHRFGAPVFAADEALGKSLQALAGGPRVPPRRRGPVRLPVRLLRPLLRAHLGARPQSGDAPHAAPRPNHDGRHRL